MKKYVVLNKVVGQTPLECAEEWRAQHPEYFGMPLAYAGRLDPMASGKLLVLIGEECKKQSEYHGLDKTYEFEVLFGVESDSADVLGIISECIVPDFGVAEIRHAAKKHIGNVTFPYPKFSSKTVKGKALHTWTLEGRLDEIEIPTYTSRIYNLELLDVTKLSRETVYTKAMIKIESIPPVTDARKAIGNDFRRPDVRASWKTFLANDTPTHFILARFICTCESGTYMRTLAESIAKEIKTGGLAFSIHRTKIGSYQPLGFGFGFWRRKF